MDDAEDSGFAGLPVKHDGYAPPAANPAPYRQFALPAKMLSAKFGLAGFTKEDASFRMIELGTREQDHAAKLAAGNGSVLSREMIFASISQIGGKVQNDRDRLDRWWDAIGPKAKRLVEAAFMDMQSVGEADVSSFLASGTEGIS